jgi:WD40 repeat protein
VVVWRDGANHAPVRLVGHKRDALGIAWHPEGQSLATASDDHTVRLWDLRTGGHDVLCRLDVAAKGVAWSPDGRQIAVTDESGAISLWDLASGARLFHARPHRERVYGPSWSADGRYLVTGGIDGVVCVLSASNLSMARRIDVGPSDGDGIWEAVLSDDGSRIASSHVDCTVRIWETRTGRQLATLEGHETSVRLAFAGGGRLLATAAGSRIRLWRRSDWACVATLESGEFHGVGGLGFHPVSPILAAKDTPGDGIDCWSLDLSVLSGRVQSGSLRYVNAKVVLLGDTGVGKSGLGLVLSGQSYAPTDSTHGRNVWVVDPADSEPGDERTEVREVLLWDLAGQPGYRMVHQLHLNEVAVALVVFDSRSETDPFAGVKYWKRALAQGSRLAGDGGVPMHVFLVAARADRGGTGVTRQRIDALVSDLTLDGFYETSAREGWQVPELRAAMLEAIDWSLLPTVSSTALFEEIRGFVLYAKQESRLLATVEDLFRDYDRARVVETDRRGLRTEFEACLGRIEGRGLIRRLRFGGYVLLQPELLDAYASALVLAAKDEPDGLGVIAEEDAISGRFKLADTERIESREEEKLLLIATIEELLRHEVALKETTDRGVDLLFPSQFTRERPDAPHIPGRELTFGFEGSLHNVYATLAVRLARSHLFERLEMWRNAATYRSTAGGACGIYLRELEEGVGELEVFFDAAAPDAARRQFEMYVFEHLQQRAAPGTVSTCRVRACKRCGYAVPDDLVRRKLERGALLMRCPDCERQTIALVDDGDAVQPPDAAVTEMQMRANAGRDNDVAATRLQGKDATDDFDVFLCHNSRDKDEVKNIAERLRARGINPWLDEWEIAPGARWPKELAKQLKSVRSAAVFIGAGRRGPWQDIETEMLLLRFAKGGQPMIPVILDSRRGNVRLPDFLALLQAVDMRKPEPDPFEQLIWGITGERIRF